MAKTSASILTLEGKDIWVFGGAGYLGQATVKLLVAAGAKVLCADLGNKANFFVESEELSDKVTPVTLDVNDSAAIKTFVEKYSGLRGVPHGLVNLTAASTAKKLEDISEVEFDSVNHGGLTASFLLAREVGMQMAKARRGSIVMFSSMYGMVSPYPEVYKEPLNKNPIEYGVTKAGLIQMTRYLAVHWAKSNVRCNCISPGPFPNPSIQKDHPDFIERLCAKSPMGRIGQSEEVAGAVAFLLSDAASYINGHNLPVDGGWTSW